MLVVRAHDVDIIRVMIEIGVKVVAAVVVVDPAPPAVLFPRLLLIAAIVAKLSSLSLVQ